MSAASALGGGGGGASVVLHVGLHKSGTTWLQRRVFADTRRFTAVLSDRDIRRLLLDVDEVGFRSADVQRALERRPVVEGTVPVVSHESLSGHFLAAPDVGLVRLERLARCFPDARVVLGVREQASMLVSAWRHYVKVGGGETLRQFVAPLGGPGYGARFHPRWLEYDRVTDRLHALFGPERVIVMPFELLRTDVDGYLHSLAGFVGCAPLETTDRASLNVGRDATASRVQSVANRLVSRSRTSPSPLLAVPRGRSIAGTAAQFVSRLAGPRAERWLDDRDREFATAWVADRYGPSNARLGGLTGVDVSRWGYVTSG